MSCMCGPADFVFRQFGTAGERYRKFMDSVSDFGRVGLFPIRTYPINEISATTSTLAAPKKRQQKTAMDFMRDEIDV